MTNDHRRIRKIQSIHIKKQLGGYVGAISKVSTNLPRNIWKTENYTLRGKIKNIRDIFINSKIIYVLIALMMYIFIGGIIFQMLEPLMFIQALFIKLLKDKKKLVEN